MSMFLKFKTNRFDALWMFRLVAITFFSAGMTNAQFSPNDLKTLITRQKDGADPHEIVLAMSGVERTLREGSEAAKLAGILQVIDLAAVIYRTHDTTVPTDRSVGRLPDFDATQFGEKPIFLGADPRTHFTNPKAKEAYDLALAKHEQLSTRVAEEMHKLEEGDYSARVAFRIIESSENRKALSAAVEKHIASIQDAQWIKDRLTLIVLSKPQTKEKSPLQSDSATKESPTLPKLSSTPRPLSSVVPPAPEKQPAAKATSLKPSEESASSKPWSIVVELFMASGSLLWLLLKRRS